MEWTRATGNTASTVWNRAIRRRRSGSNRSGVVSRGSWVRWSKAWVYGAVPTRVLPLAVSAALKVADVFALNLGPYSFFWPL